MSGGTGGSATAGTGGTGGTKDNTPPKFANGFENGNVGQAPPSPWTGGGPGRAVIDESKFYSGKRSLKVTSSGDEAMVSLLVTNILPAPRKTAYVRFMIWLNNLPGTTQTGRGHWNIMEHKGVMKGGGFNIVGEVGLGGFQEDTLKFQVFGDDTGGKGRLDCVKEDVMLLSVKEWNCVEMKIDENDILNYGVSIDEMDVPSFSFIYDAATSVCHPGQNLTNNVWYLPEITQTRFGWRYHPRANQPKPVTLWIDDIVIDTKPIGCPQK